jgi:hypothetical protein
VADGKDRQRKFAERHDMIDHVLAFADESSARSDPIVGEYWVSGGEGGGWWRGDVCIPDARVTVAATGASYDGLWRIVIAKDAQDQDLTDLPACHLVADRSAAAAGQPFIIKSDLTVGELALLVLQPVFAGSTYPFGSPA